MSRVSIMQLQNSIRSIEAMRLACPDPEAPRVEAPPSLPPFDASTLPERQQAALIFLTESHVKRSIVGKLLEDSQEFLRDADFAPLRELGLAEKPEGYRLNKITRDGNVSAKALTKALCIKHNIHLLTEGGPSGWQVRFSCPCGFSTMVRRSHTARSNATIQHANHVRTSQGIKSLFDAMQPPARAEG